MFSATKSLLCPSTLLFNKKIFIRHNKADSKTSKGGLLRDVTVRPSLVKGMDFITYSRFYQGLAFTIEERQAIGIHGLLAPGYQTLEEQLQMCQIAMGRYKNNLNQYLYLAELHDTNERLFFNLLNTDVEKYMPVVYTPTVGLACQKFGLAYRRPRGLFISIQDKGHILGVLKNWPVNDVRAIVFTDGERILGLGDLGAYGMGIPIGKLALYTALAGVKPHQCLPITLDVGTNTEKLWADPFYIGLRKKRTTGDEFIDFIDEFMVACVERFGSHILLQFEDFALANATSLLSKYKECYCTFNDDIQGTASVAVAGIIASQRITKRKMSDNIYMFLGAGSASTGIGNLLVDAMKEEGVQKKDGEAKIFMFDIDGLLTTKRKNGVPPHATNFGKDLPPEDNFEKCVETYKPTVLIGCSTVGGAFTPAILKLMAKNSDRPVIFALSNPTVKAECTPQQAYDETEGRCIYASGSPFPPVKHGGKEYHTGQGNNSYIFPGVALGVIASQPSIIPDNFFLTAAKALAEFVHESDLQIGRVYPPLSDLRKVSFAIAIKVADEAYDSCLARNLPRPPDTQELVKSYLYDLNYPNVLPSIYDFPIHPLKGASGPQRRRKCP